MVLEVKNYLLSIGAKKGSEILNRSMFSLKTNIGTCVIGVLHKEDRVSIAFPHNKLSALDKLGVWKLNTTREKFFSVFSGILEK